MYRPYGLIYAVHGYKVTHTACQYKAVKNFMGTEVFMQSVEYRKFAGINDAADGVNNSACKQPAKSMVIKQCNDVREGKHAQPSHGDV